MNDDIAIRVSRRKDDVLRANDYQVLFSSNAPALKVVASGFISKGTPVNSTIVEHKLGYKPFHLLMKKPLTPATFALGAYGQEKNDSLDQFGVDNDRLYVSKVESGTTTVSDHYYTIFDLDLNKPFVAPKVNPGKTGDSGAKDKDFTFRITKGAPVTSNDMKEFAVHSERQPILVDRVIQYMKSANVAEELEFIHDLGYPPAFYMFGPVTAGGNNDQPYYMYEIAPESSNGAQLAATETKLKLKITLNGAFSLVILKDPIL